ncbi:MAG: choice-of-anchor D domain-containing protein, partial [Bacteroidia bacterium]
KVYYNNNGSWSQIGSTIIGDNNRDDLGQSVAISNSGNVIALGAQGGDYVKVYKLVSGNWSLLGSKITGTTGTAFGWRVSLSANGETVAISAIYDEQTSQDDRGIVRVYEYNSGSSSWVQKGSDITGEADKDESGFDISLSANGDRLAISAIKNDGPGAGVSIGHVRVYEYNSGWSQLGSDINGEAYGDQSGVSVSLSGNGTRVAIGSIVNKGGTANYNVGHVRVFEYSTTWSQLGADIDGDATPSTCYFGSDVALNYNGSKIIIGAKGHEKVKYYNYINSSWTQIGNTFTGGSNGEYFGFATDISAWGAIGAIGDHYYRYYYIPGSAYYWYGAVKVYNLTPQEPEIKLLGNSVEIVDGDNSPSSNDFTDFGNVEVIRTKESRVFQIQNTGNGQLNLTGTPRVQISGTNASDFKVVAQPNAAISSSNSVTFTINFDPSSFGQRNATVTIVNNDADEDNYSFDITGIGATPTGGTRSTLSVNNMYLDVKSGTYLNVDHLHYFGSADVSNGGNVTVKGDWSNQTSATVSGDGIYDVEGSSSQNVSPNGATIRRMIIDNANDVSLESEGTIQDLTLTDGDLDIGDNDLTLTGTVSGGNSDSYIKISGNGKVKRTVNSSAVTLPIGRNPYLPIIISEGGGAEYTVGVYNDVYDNPVSENTVQTANAVSETWTIQADQAVDDVDVQIGWEAAEELSNFDRTLSTLAYWESGVNSTWTNSGTTTAASGTGPYYQNITVSFSTNLYYFGVASAGSPLPIELGDFNAEWLTQGSLAKLNWTTFNEYENSHFIVERSFDGLDFKSIGRVEGAGTTIDQQLYQFIDNELEGLNSAVYYRLVQFDYNGDFSVSKTRVLEQTQSKVHSLTIFPNPTMGKLNIATEHQDFQINIYSIQGLLVNNVHNTKQLDLSNLPAGEYIAEVIANNSVERAKFTIIR